MGDEADWQLECLERASLEHPAGPNPHYCDAHGKRRYQKKADADAKAREREKQIAHALDTYKCPECGGWHLTKSIGLKPGPPALATSLREIAGLNQPEPEPEPKPRVAVHQPYPKGRKMDLNKFLKTTPESLAKEQHDALKHHALSVLRAITKMVEAEMYDSITEVTGFSPAGDECGLDNHFIDFSLDGQKEAVDIGDTIDRLAQLKGMAK